VQRVTEGWAANDYARIVDGRLELPKDEALALPTGAVQLKHKIAKLLPQIRLTDLPTEVDDWIGLRAHFPSHARPDKRPQRSTGTLP
jgi:hypothetical protein